MSDKGAKRRGILPLLLALLASAGPLAPGVLAGPPFLTDDPQPIDYKHWEFYTFSTLDKARDGTAVQAPAFEFNYGFGPNFQLHVIPGFATSVPEQGPAVFGPADTEFGIKYRFAQETDAAPMIGVFPMLEIPTGDAGRGLGNGRAWAKFPLWLQKSWGEEHHQWTTCGGGGLSAYKYAPLGRRVKSGEETECRVSWVGAPSPRPTCAHSYT